MLYKEDFYNADYIRKKRKNDVDRHGKKKANQDGNEVKKKSRRWMLKDCLKTRQDKEVKTWRKVKIAIYKKEAN